MKKNLMAAEVVLALTHCTSFPPGGNNRSGWYEERCAEKKMAIDDFEANPDLAHLDHVIELDVQHAEGCRSGE
ncbi:hypothetical protein [Klebsiella pneumoniae]|uniref:hypothetical protein n=1 Tax=Klebsiella pneumoniae TaxID=573 RepID=UPI003F798E6A